ncbi:hypothetical protein BDQ12DRAFT_671920 [Crucibulum laeve]|uniref:Uncharacterized protein n=1 Tax=Crucibulum laeve TaxID=68775 RepID=A0A5C3LFF6_9AGAR|nr:hypothetical protein BDQ12DRAFT_671920 [Crucibulum laeve]
MDGVDGVDGSPLQNPLFIVSAGRVTSANSVLMGTTLLGQPLLSLNVDDKLRTGTYVLCMHPAITIGPRRGEQEILGWEGKGCDSAFTRYSTRLNPTPVFGNTREQEEEYHFPNRGAVRRVPAYTRNFGLCSNPWTTDSNSVSERDDRPPSLMRSSSAASYNENRLLPAEHVLHSPSIASSDITTFVFVEDEKQREGGGVSSVGGVNPSVVSPGEETERVTVSMDIVPQPRFYNMAGWKL